MRATPRLGSATSEPFILEEVVGNGLESNANEPEEIGEVTPETAKEEVVVVNMTKTEEKEESREEEKAEEAEEDYYEDCDPFCDYTDPPDYADEDTGYRRKRPDFSQFSDKRNTSDAESLPQDIQCALVTTLREKCASFSLLEAWRYEPALVAAATQEEILLAVNMLRRRCFIMAHITTPFPALCLGTTPTSPPSLVASEETPPATLSAPTRPGWFGPSLCLRTPLLWRAR